MDGLISFGLGLLTFVAAFCLAGLARAMRNDKLPPNMWAGIRTKAASESESSWYQVQRAGSVPLICLAVAYADSGLLFILQGIYHEVISPLIPVVVFSAQSLVGIIWIYKASSNSDPSQNQSGTSEVSERIKKVNSAIVVPPIISSQKRDVAVERALVSLCACGSLS